MAFDDFTQAKDSLRDIQTRLEDMVRSLQKRCAYGYTDDPTSKRITIALGHIECARNCMDWSVNCLEDCSPGKERVLK